MVRTSIKINSNSIRWAECGQAPGHRPLAMQELTFPLRVIAMSKKSIDIPMDIVPSILAFVSWHVAQHS